MTNELTLLERIIDEQKVQGVILRRAEKRLEVIEAAVSAMRNEMRAVREHSLGLGRAGSTQQG